MRNVSVVPFVRYIVAFAAAVSALNSAFAQTNVNVRIMAANLNGDPQSYQPFALRILQGTKADVVCIQEFNFSNNAASDFRYLLDTCFGTNFNYYREPYNGGNGIPNGIISRWPIVASGSWNDLVQTQPNRGFAWAQIDVPGTNNLYVVSVHLLTDTAAHRATETANLKALMQTNFPAGAWAVVAGDFNADPRTEACVMNFNGYLTDSPIPVDNNGDSNTSEARNANGTRKYPHDYVLPSLTLANFETATVLPSHSFPGGLVFDSTVYTPLSDVSPVQFFDSTNAQHMAVMKDFSIPAGAATNPPVITVQPQGQTNAVGASITFSVAATGGGTLAYQWLFGGANIAGATTNPFTITNVQLTNAGNYAVIITNFAGSATSGPALLSVLSTQSAIIAQWNFNSLVSDTNANTGTRAVSTGSGTNSYAGGAAANSGNEFAGGVSSDPNTADNSAWITSSYPSASMNNKTAGVQFNVSTAGRQNIVISWASQASPSGSKYGHLQYSTDGSTFADFPTCVTNPTSFSLKTNSLAGFTGVNDNPNFAFRIVSEFEATATGAGANSYVASGTYGSGGTLRFDMVTVSGAPFVAPASAVLASAAVSGGQFGFNVSGSAGASYVVLASTNLISTNWLPVFTNVAPFSFGDTNLAAPQRYYRAVSQ